MLLGKKAQNGEQSDWANLFRWKIPTMLQMVDETICNILFHQKYAAKCFVVGIDFFQKSEEVRKTHTAVR